MKKLVSLIMAVLILTGCAKEASKVTENLTVRQHITLAFSGEPEFGPHSADNPSMGFCLGMIYEPLWRMDKNGELSPVLGKEIVNRGEKLDIYLAESAKWHDGSNFTPEDVVYTISIITGGMSVYPKGVIEGARVSGKNCVTVSLAAAIFEPERLFTFPIVKNGAPVSTKEPIGTGIYKFSGKGGFDTYLFQPFDESDSPNLRMIRVRDKYRETELFKSGITDIQFVENSNLRDYIPLESSKEIKYPTNHMIYIGINTANLSSYFRRAVFYSLDTLNMAEEIYGSRARAVSVPYLSEDSFSYRHFQNLSLSLSELRAGGFVSDKGKLFLGKDAVSVTIGVKDGDGHKEVAEALGKALSRMGAEYRFEQWNPDFDNAYDMVIATDNIQKLLEENPRITRSLHSKTDFNNFLFSDVPLIPIALGYNAVYISNRVKSETFDNFPLFFR